MTAASATSSDITTLFKSCVKTIQTRNKAIGIPYSPSKILPPSLSPFFCKARDIQSSINSHMQLLSEHKKKYINDNSTSLSDVEKSYMDKVVLKNLNIIEDNIKTLEANFKEKNNNFNKDCDECHQCTISILRNNYIDIYTTFRDMKDLRQRKMKQKEQLFRLQRPANFKGKSSTIADSYSTCKTSTNLGPEKSFSRSHSVEQNGDLSNREVKSESHSMDSLNGSLSSSAMKQQSSTVDYLEVEKEENLQHLDEEEKKLLEEENKHLYNELMSNHEEVKHITRQVVELGRMQDILTENVEAQSQQIDDIHDSILLATDNVQRGNEQVREAMRKDASFRVWIMFFLIVMSCTILFLDWYSP